MEENSERRGKPSLILPTSKGSLEMELTLKLTNESLDTHWIYLGSSINIREQSHGKHNHPSASSLLSLFPYVIWYIWHWPVENAYIYMYKYIKKCTHHIHISNACFNCLFKNYPSVPFLMKLWTCYSNKWHVIKEFLQVQNSKSNTIREKNRTDVKSEERSIRQNIFLYNSVRIILDPRYDLCFVFKVVVGWLQTSAKPHTAAGLLSSTSGTG